MKVRLLESAHKFYAIEGTEGTLESVDGNYRFQPDGAEFKLWIGRVKWEEEVEMADHVNGEVVMGGPVAQQKTRKRGK